MSEKPYEVKWGILGEYFFSSGWLGGRGVCWEVSIVDFYECLLVKKSCLMDFSYFLTHGRRCQELFVTFLKYSYQKET